MLFEEDTVLFYCTETKGYVYSNPPWIIRDTSSSDSKICTKSSSSKSSSTGTSSSVEKLIDRCTQSRITIQSRGFSTKADAFTKESDALAKESTVLKKDFDASEKKLSDTREPDSLLDSDGYAKEPDVIGGPDASMTEPIASSGDFDASAKDPDPSTKECDASSTESLERESDSRSMIESAKESPKDSDVPTSASATVSSIKDSDFSRVGSNLTLPCVQFAAFQIKPALDYTDDEYQYKIGNTKLKPYRRPLVYGRKVKLYHRASDMYVHIAPPTDRNKNPVGILKLEPTEEENEDLEGIFRILPPPDSGKDRGEDVQIKDKIILECLAMKGNYVFFAKNSLTQRYEMKLGVAYSPLTIEAHTTDQSHGDSAAVKSGDVALLFNWGHHAYVSSRGSFACEMLPKEMQPQTSNVALIVKSLKNRQGVQKPAPTSSDAFWQFECLECPVAGNQLKYKEDCLIKHLPTQQYLAAVKQDGKYEVCLRKLTSVADMSDICFCLARFERDSEKKSDDKIEKSGYVEIRHSKTKRLLSIDVRAECDDQGRTRFDLLLLESDAKQDDYSMVFKLEVVKPEVVREIYSVIGCVSVFNEYMEHLNSKEDSSSFDFFMDEFKETLVDIRHWLMGAGQISRSKAKMLHTTMLIDQLMGFLSSVTVTTDATDDEERTLCVLINRVLLQYLMCSDKKLHHDLAETRFVLILLKKIGYNTQAENVLVELIRDDEKLAFSVMDQLTSESELKLQLTPETMEMFGAMCFSAGKPLKGMQEKILEVIIKKDEELYRTQLLDGKVCFTSASAIPEHLREKPLADLKEEQYLTFYIAQIKLLGQLCKGGNIVAKERIVDKKIITFEIALVVFRDIDTDVRVQSAYLDFVQAAFVDNALDQSGIDISNIWRCYVYYEIKENPLNALADTHEFTDYAKEMTELQEIIEERLRILNEDQHTEFLKSEFNTKLLSVLESLVEFGFYWKGKASDGSFDVIDCLVKLLDDCPTDKAKCILVVIHLYFKQLSYVAIGCFIYDFKRCMEGGLSISGTVSRLDNYFKVNGYHCLDICENQTLIEKLIKLLHSENDDVLFKSAQLLFDLYKREKILFNDAANSFIVKTATEIHDEWVQYGSFTDKHKVLLKLHKGTLDEEGREEVLELLNDLAENCVLEDDKAEPNPCLQGIAYSSRLFSQMLTYVLLRCMEEKDSLSEYELTVLPKACQFLSACMTRGNTVAQAYLFEHFMDLVGANVCQYDIAQMLTETLSDDESLCQRIDAPELQQIFKVATGSLEDSIELCTTLQAAMKIKRLSKPAIIRRTQETIIRLIEDTRTASYRYFIQRENRDVRLEILKSSEDGPEVMLLVNLVDTMSVCSEEKYYLGKQFSRRVFSVDELLQVLADKEVCFVRKKPFARLLTEAYLYSDKETVCAKLAKQEKFWAHVEYCAELLNCVCSSIPEDDCSLSVALKLLATKHLSVKGWVGIAKKYKLDFTVNDEKVLLSSALLYLWEGAIPLVTAYCQTYYNLKHSGPSSKLYSRLMEARHLSVLTSFAESLMVIAGHDRVGVLVTTESQIAMFKHCVDALHHVIDTEGVKSHLRQSKDKLDSLKDKKSAVVQEYISKYDEEEKLNKQFQEHVNRCRQEYICDSKKRFLDVVMAPGTVVPRDRSFVKLVEKFKDKENKDNVESLKRLLRVQQFRKTKTTKERTELNQTLFTCLQLLTSLSSAYLPNSAKLLQDMSTRAPLDEEQMVNELGVVKEKQKEFLDTGVHKEVLLHLSHNREDHVVLSMAFLSTLLHFGNEQAQEEILGFLVQRSNVTLFKTMHSILGGRLPMDEVPVNKFQHQPQPASTSTSSHVSIPMESQSPESTDGDTNDRVIETSLTSDDQLCTCQSVRVVVAKQDAVHNSVILLDLLSWMCDGQNKKMQDMLRKQDTGLNCFNIVGQVATLLVSIADHLDKGTFKMAERALQALIETCAGNYHNQESAFKAQIVDALNQIFIYKCKTKPFTERVVVVQMLKYSALELLEVLLEETDKQSDTLGRAISEDIHVSNIVECMESLWIIHEEEISPREGLVLESHQETRIEDRAKRALYKGFHNLRKMSYFLKVPVETLVSKCDQKMLDYVKNWSHSVEVEYMTTDGTRILTKAYFPFNPEVDKLNDTKRDVIEAKINRDSQEDKVKDLLNWVDHIEKDRKHKEKWFPKWVDYGSDIRFYLLSLLTIMMNLFIIILFQAPSSGSSGNGNITIGLPDTPSWYHNYVIFIFGFIHLVLTVWMVLEYFATKWPHFRFYRIRKAYANMKRYLDKKFHRNKLSSKSPNPSNYQIQGYEVDFISFVPIYTIFFLFCSILSLGFQGYFYCFCLFYIFLRFPTLSTVLNALRRSFAQLILVFGVIFVIIFVYSVISFAFLHNFFNNQDGQFCDSLGQCYVSVLRGGLLDTLGSDTISLTTSGMTQPLFTVVALRMVLDISFFIIVTTLGLNIVIAILVDRFSELREERDKLKDDQKKKCFVCGIGSDSFDQKGHGFKNHIRDDHNKWNYIYFILYLRTIPENDRNALEKEVSKKVWPDKSIDFFPLHKAKTLPKENTKVADD